MKNFLFLVLPLFSIAFLNPSVGLAAKLDHFDYIRNRHSQFVSKITVDYGAEKNQSSGLSGKVVIWDDDGLASLAFLLKIHQQIQLSQPNQDPKAPVLESEATYYALKEVSRYFSRYLSTLCQDDAAPVDPAESSESVELAQVLQSKPTVPPAPERRSPLFSWRTIAKFFGYWSQPQAEQLETSPSSPPALPSSPPPAPFFRPHCAPNPYFLVKPELDQLIQYLERKDPKNLTKADLDAFQNCISPIQRNFVYNVHGASKNQLPLGDLQFYEEDWTGDFEKLIRDFSQQVRSQSRQPSIAVDISLPLDDQDFASFNEEEDGEEEFSFSSSQMGALQLAISHFNSDHSSPLESGGKEFYFMKAAQAAVAEEFPLLHGFHVGIQDPIDRWFLELLFSDKSGPHFQKIMGSLSPLIVGCKKSESSRSGSFYAKYHLTDSRCQNKEAVEIFRSLGLDTLTLHKRQYADKNEVSFSFIQLRLFPKEIKLRDTKHFHEGLRRSPQTRALAEALDLGHEDGRAYVGILHPFKTELKLVKNENTTQPGLQDSFQLNYEVKWWDRNFRHQSKRNWMVQVTPRNFVYDLENRKVRFQSELVVFETGDELDGKVVEHLLRKN